MSPQVLEKFMQDVTARRFREAIHRTPDTLPRVGLA